MLIRPKKDKYVKEKFRINKDIKAGQVRVVDTEGTMLGIMDCSEALKIASDKGLDLIEIAPNANPPTCKIMDYGKYKYEQKKKAQESKKKQTIISIKEIQIRPRTDAHDLTIKLNHARRFLENGDKTKITMRFRGREMAHQDIGRQQIKKVIKALEDVSVVEFLPKMEGRQMFVMLNPTPDILKKIAQKKKESIIKRASVSFADQKKQDSPPVQGIESHKKASG